MKTFSLVLAFFIFIAIFIAIVNPANAVNVYVKTIPEKPTAGNFILSVTVSSDTPIYNANILLSGLVNKAVDVGSFSGNATFQFKVKAEPGVYSQEVLLSYSVYNGSYTSRYVKCIKEIVVTEKPKFEIVKVESCISPGKSGELNVKVLNSGGIAKNVKVTLIGLPANGVRVFKEWKSGEVKTLSYKVFMNESVRVGSYPLKLEISCYDSFENYYEFSLPFSYKVIGKPELVISLTSPKIYSDSSFTLNLSVENAGKTKAKNVQLKLILPKGFRGDNFAYLGDIGRNEVKTAKMYLKTEKNVSGEKKLIVKVKCDGYSWNYSYNLYVFPINMPHLDVSGVYTIPDRPITGKLTLNLAVENSGKGIAKGVEVKLILPNGLKGRDTYFIGSLKSGDSATSTFALIAEKAGKYSITAEIKYLDSAMRRHEVNQTFTIYVFSSSNYSYLLIIPIIVLGYWVMRKWRS